MVDRRVFLQGSLGAAAALIGTARAAAAPTARRPAEAPPDVVIVDRGLAGGRAFATDARKRGVVPLEFSSDAGRIWMHELEPRLRLGPATIEGYTSAATLFCLELLARDYGARIVRRSETAAGVAWILSSSPMQRAALAPLSRERSRPHA